MADKKDKTYVIPQNYEDNLVTSTGISYRNIIEGAILFGICALIFWFLPLPLKVRVILIVIFGGSLGALGIIGIHHYSLSEFLMLVIHFKMADKELKKDTIFEKEIAEDDKKDIDEKVQNPIDDTKNAVEIKNPETKTQKKKKHKKEKSND